MSSSLKVKFSSRVVRVGHLTNEFISAGVLVFFGPKVPEELLDFAVIHEGGELAEPIKPGDKFCLDGECYNILAVGDVANKNLASLGHFIIKFNGQVQPEMPGDICAEARPLPSVKIGSVFKFVSFD
ncbi:MAG: PTS glucitol/sorbitol transporter subunit IIA [Thermanaerothrix sp.]|uniref:PTS glucitol/sorbitol transporter subunit IIA n=1 Tax=Thermanaerothrix sp. TaxID=2972675 RepID=UPI003C79E15D